MKKIFFLLAMMVAANAFAYDKQTWNYETGAKLSTGASGVHALDIYYPETGEGSYPVFIWLSSGIGMGGSATKESAYSMASVLIDTVLQRGYAVVVPSSRSVGQDNQPLPLHDIKAVVRFLRNNGEGMSECPQNIDTSFIAVGGVSPGGLIATMMGFSRNWRDEPWYEGTVGNFTDKSSSVDAVADWSGIHTAGTNLNNVASLYKNIAGCSGSEDYSYQKFLYRQFTSKSDHDPAPEVMFRGSKDGIVLQEDTETLYNWLHYVLGDDSEYYLINGQGHGLIIDSSKYYYYGYMVNFFDRIRAKKAAAATAVEQIGQDANAKHQKLLIDGHLLIEHNGKTYNAQGAQVK